MQKCIEVYGWRGESYINLTEMPGDMVRIEGIREDPYEVGTLLVNKILFSKEAIEKIVPILQEWLESKKGE